MLSGLMFQNFSKILFICVLPYESTKQHTKISWRKFVEKQTKNVFSNIIFVVDTKNQIFCKLVKDFWFYFTDDIFSIERCSKEKKTLFLEAICIFCKLNFTLNRIIDHLLFLKRE